MKQQLKEYINSKTKSDESDKGSEQKGKVEIWRKYKR